VLLRHCPLLLTAQRSRSPRFLKGRYGDYRYSSWNTIPDEDIGLLAGEVPPPAARAEAWDAERGPLVALRHPDCHNGPLLNNCVYIQFQRFHDGMKLSVAFPAWISTCRPSAGRCFALAQILVRRLRRTRIWARSD